MMAGEDRRRFALDWFVAHPTVEVRRWCDPVTEACGFDARDVYVETYWLPILGPSTVLAVRRLATWLVFEPDGLSVNLVEFGSSLGIGTGTGRHTQINRTLGRLIDFNMARINGDHFEIRTSVPPVPERLRRRLPLTLFDSLTDHDRSCLDSA